MNNRKQKDNLQELKNLSIIIPNNCKGDFKNLVNLFELGAFQNVKTALNLAQRLKSSGEGPVKAIEKINAMQSEYIKQQTKESRPFLSASAFSNLDSGIEDDEPTQTQTPAPPTPAVKLSKLITKKAPIKKQTIRKPALKKEKVVLQSFHITADITCDIVYVKITKTGKKYEVRPTETKYNPKESNDHIFRGVNEEIFATSELDAIDKFDDFVQSSFHGVTGGVTSPEIRSTSVKSIGNIHVVNMSSGIRTSPSDIMMKRSVRVCYNFIPDDSSLLKNNEEIDMCVPTQFLAIYSPLIKKLTNESFIDLCYKAREQTTITVNLLDLGIDRDDSDEPKPWTIADGVSPSMLHKICQKLNISHYAYDFSNNCFLKHISTIRNYPVLCYYAISGHMYYVSNKGKNKING